MSTSCTFGSECGAYADCACGEMCEDHCKMECAEDDPMDEHDYDVDADDDEPNEYEDAEAAGQQRLFGVRPIEDAGAI